MKKSLSRIILCATVLTCINACSEKAAPSVSAPRKELPVNSVQSAEPPTLTVDAPSPTGETEVSPPNAVAGLPLSLGPQHDPSGLKLEIDKSNAGGDTLHLVDAAAKMEVVQTPVMRLEARAQAMKEMRLERAQQK
jgi:hypothetical protein